MKSLLLIISFVAILSSCAQHTTCPTYMNKQVPKVNPDTKRV